MIELLKHWYRQIMLELTMEPKSQILAGVIFSLLVLFAFGAHDFAILCAMYYIMIKVTK